MQKSSSEKNMIYMDRASHTSLDASKFDLAKLAVILDLPQRIVEPYSWVSHIPAAFALMELLKPQVFVELGVHSGNSYNAFCQAVKHYKIHCSCYGIDTFKGDEHAGEYQDEIFRDLSAFQEANYSEFSKLCRMTFDEGLNNFSDGGVDLLHIDGLHTYEAVKHDYESWFPKLSPKGVVVFHDTQVREHGFGVWKLWDELKDKYPSFDFSHGYGLGILAVGPEVNSEFLSFLEALNKENFYSILFARLGAFVHESTLLSKLRKDYMQDIELHNETKGKLLGSENELKLIFKQRQDFEDKLSKTVKEYADVCHELEKIIERHASLQSQYADLEEKFNIRSSYLEEVQTAKASVEAQLKMFLNSFSWKITAPIRSLKRRIMG